MPKNTSVLLGNQFNRLIAKAVASGRYSSASEVIRAGLRLLEAETAFLKGIQKALITGKKVGSSVSLTLKSTLRKYGRK